MFSAKPKTPRPTGCCAQQMKRFHSLTAGQPFDTNPVSGAAAPLTTPRKGFFDRLNRRTAALRFFDTMMGECLALLTGIGFRIGLL